MISIMTVYSSIVSISWAVIIVYWLVSAMRVKKNVEGGAARVFVL